MMEFLDSRGVRPEHLIVGVSPMDFTMKGVLHGRQEIATRHVAPVVVPEPAPTRWTRAAVFALLHSATPERHRNIGKWLQLRFFFQAEDGIRDGRVTGVQTCALPI